MPNRKAYPGLIRDPYKFGKDLSFQQEDMITAVRNCPCTETPVNTDPDPQVECFIDEYTLCGTAGAVLASDSISPPKYYLRADDPDVTNPDEIFVPMFGLASWLSSQGITILTDTMDNGGCFTKTAEGIDCNGVTGHVLGMDEWRELPPVEGDDLACDKAPCVGDIRCEYLKFKICSNDPDAANVNPQYIIIHHSFFPGVFGVKTVLYKTHCYTTLSTPCRDDPGNDVKPAYNELTIVLRCTDSRCQGCCDGIGTKIDALVQGLAERIRFANTGNLPAVGGHNWTDPTYILAQVLSVGSLLVNGMTVNTPCEQRSENFRLILVEVDYWLHSSTYLYGRLVGDKWINSDVYPDGDIAGFPLVPIDVFAAPDYESQIQAAVAEDWFRFVFLGPNSAGEMYTQGGEGGFGTVDLIRFGDSNPHVITNIANQAFCDLLTSTVARMLTAVQKLISILGSSAGGTSTMIGTATFGCGEGGSDNTQPYITEAKTCAQTSFSGGDGTQDFFADLIDFDPGNCTDIEPTPCGPSFDFPYGYALAQCGASDLFTIAQCGGGGYTEANAIYYQYREGQISVDSASYAGFFTIKIYAVFDLTLATTSCGSRNFQSPTQFGSPSQGTFTFLGEGSLYTFTDARTGVSTYINDTVDAYPDCNAVGWEVGNNTVVFFGIFSI